MKLYISELRRMELNAGDTLVLAIVMLEECPRQHVNSTDLGCSSCFFVAEHLEVILKDIDQFIRLKRFLNSVRNSVNELIELLSDGLVLLGVFLHLAHEVIRVVLHDGIDLTVEVGLR